MKLWVDTELVWKDGRWFEGGGLAVDGVAVLGFDRREHGVYDGGSGVARDDGLVVGWWGIWLWMLGVSEGTGWRTSYEGKAWSWSWKGEGGSWLS